MTPMFLQNAVRRVLSVINLKSFSPQKQIMDVTAQNFDEKLAYIENSIDESIFLSIDSEFTGLSIDKHQISGLDTLDERYEKSKISTTQFLMVQFGLSTFHYDAQKRSYSNKTFNFYVWPKPLHRRAPDRRFLCQASSIDFLTQHNFDFNKLFKEGIPYLREDEAQKLKTEMQERHAKYDEIRENSLNSSLNTTPKASTPGRSEYIPVPEEQKDYIDSKIKDVESWFNSEDSKTPMILDKCNPFQRRLLYQEVQKHFPDDIFMEPVNKIIEANKRPERVIQISKFDKDEQQRKINEKNHLELNELENASGFTKVINKISSSKKTVVGHNMLLDLCFMINQFVAPLPETLYEFKSLLNNNFPNICDTKLMANTTPLKEDITDTSLEELLRILLQGKPFDMPDVASGLVDNENILGYLMKENMVQDVSGSSEKYHDAAYDAFATGLCFLCMLDRLASLIKPESAKSNSKKFVLSTSEECISLAKPFLNKLNMMRLPDIPYMNISGEDIIPNRDHVFYINFPPEWKATDLLNLFSPSFGPIQITWIDDISAYISLREHPENAKLVMSTLNCSSVYNIMPYMQYKKLHCADKNSTNNDRAKGLTLSTHLTDSADKNQICTTGITPMVEKNIILDPNSRNTSNGGVKRAASPNPSEARKRSKSEENKVFQESSDWE